MSQQQARGSGAAAAPALPDINSETYPFDLVQQALDQAAYVNLFARPAERSAIEPIRDRDGGVIGFHAREVLHRFRISLLTPSASGGLRATNVVGEPLGRSEHRWLVAPEGFEPGPGRVPPATRYEAQQSQLLVLDGRVELGDGRESFRGHGSGRTYPGLSGGSFTLGAVCNIIEGTGRLRDLLGTYTWSASLSLQDGLSGNLLCRFVDPQGLLRTERSLPELRVHGASEAGVVYLPFRGQKTRNQRTFYTFDDGQVSGIRLDPQIRQVEVDAALDERGEIRSTISVGAVVGRMDAWIFLDLLSPLPAAQDVPIPFRDYDEYYFLDTTGGQVASLGADGGGGRRIGRAASVPGEGISYSLRLPGLPGQSALRFGGFAPALRGTGRLAGAAGLMTHNSAVGLMPHVLSTVFILRLADPSGALRA